MGVHITEKESVFANRRKRLLRQLRGQAAVFISPPPTLASRDRAYPYVPNTDFYYLTGFSEPEAALVLLGTAKGTRSILYLRERVESAEKWTGERLGLKRARRRFLVDEVRDIANFLAELPETLKGYTTLHYAGGTHPKYDALVWSLFQNSYAPRPGLLHTIRDSRLLTAEMRIIKDRLEIGNIQHAVDITARALRSTFREVKSCSSERYAAALVESHFARLGADGPAFESTVASGRNATTLHHTPSQQPLWKRELVLFDVGASYRGYAADITRTIPASGIFSTAQGEVYDIVYGALQAALAKAQPGSCLDEVHQTAVRALTAGLVSLGVLKGSTAQLVSQKAFFPYFMHSIGHWLGLDVHDISPCIAGGQEFPSALRPFQAGMVLTIEPGLYFPYDDEGVPKAYRGIGIRLEEDVLITASGHDVLSKDLPIERSEVTALFSGGL